MPNTTYFGDLHANTLKMLIGLKDEGIITNLDVHYANLKQAYDQNNVGAFNALIDQLQFDPIAVGNTSLCYIGDVLADRGQNDAMTLYLLHTMSHNNVDYEIIYSNHDHEFVSNLQHMRNGTYAQITHNLYRDAHQDQAKSLTNFRQTLIDQDIQQPLLGQMLDNYLAKLKLVSVKFDPNDNPVVATHAPLNRNIIDQINQQAPYYDSVVDKAIDINKSFSDKIADGSIRNIDQNSLEYQLIWNRDCGHGHFLQSLDTADVSKTLYHIHGHDSAGAQRYPNSHNLDNATGKGITLNYATNIDAEKVTINTTNPAYDNIINDNLQLEGIKNELIDIGQAAIDDMKARKGGNIGYWSEKKAKAIKVVMDEIYQMPNATLDGNNLKNKLNQLERVISHKRWGSRNSDKLAHSYVAVSDRLTQARQDLGLVRPKPSFKVSETPQHFHTFDTFINQNQAQMDQIQVNTL
ncbi:MAG: hypothetical protein EP298_08485 [Gammaproteobacteria bacterium]|nr:MAG: hypothetical protein EP298_08485 [Gammaproteobacteria bacterium]UTW42838.1 hypothetical protein KFE69_01475 [bacterium SCSIO 12844]